MTVRKLILAALLSLSACVTISQTKYTYKDFGLRLRNRHIDYSGMTKAQKDTILIDMFTYEDNLLDIAVYYRSLDSIVIYRNDGDGYLSHYRGVSTRGKKVSSISVINPDYTYLPATSKSGIRINYTDGGKKDYTSKEITENFITAAGPQIPYRNILDDARAFLYDISFVEQWRSMQAGDPIYYTTVGDIDRDGKNEVIYTFDISPYSIQSRIVVFENVTQSQYRIDWDTLLLKGGYTLGYPLFDFDKDGNKEFWAYMYMNVFDNYEIGLYECYGEGKYKFRSTSFSYPNIFAMDFKDSIMINGVSKPGLWAVYSDPHGGTNTTHIYKYRVTTKTNSAYGFNPIINNLNLDFFVYNIAAEDFDKDGKEEIILGDAQWSSYSIGYLDSTGAGTNHGYELKEMDFSEPLSAGYLVSNDLDGDGTKEFITCGIGNHSGCMGVIKHTGAAGTNQWTPMWWDTAGIRAMPNISVDTGRINGKYTLLYPTVEYGYGYPRPYPILHLLTYTRDGTYSFYRSLKQLVDSMDFIGPTLFDIDKDGKMNILTPLGFEGITTNAQFYLCDFEQVGTIGINPINTQVPDKYDLMQNYPNPFNQSTIINYQTSTTGTISIKVYDVTGKEIAVLVNGKKNQGKYSVLFNAGNLSSGIYFYSLAVDGKNIAVKKMALVK